MSFHLRLRIAGSLRLGLRDDPRRTTILYLPGTLYNQCDEWKYLRLTRVGGSLRQILSKIMGIEAFEA
jgi:hypothetical protein